MSKGYDDNVSIISEEGRIYQVEYSAKAIESACTVTGLVCSDGVILCSEKTRNSPTLVSNSNPTIYNVTKNIGIAICGYIPDGRNIVARAVSEARSYLESFGIDISGKILAERVSRNVHMCTLYGYYRPYGACVLISSFEKNTPHLYMVENNGNCFEYYSCSNGKGRQYVKNDVEKNNFAIRNKESSLAVKDLLKSLIKSYEGEKETQYDISVISSTTNGKHMLMNKTKLDELVKLTMSEVEEERKDEIDA